jgi:two-component system, OmpR family, sensor histidine kinase KdpD
MPGRPSTSEAHRRAAIGTLAALGGLSALMLVMLPFRSHLSIATPALVFVVPVIVGVVVGGSIPGVVGAVAGFVLYDVFFLPPFGRLTVRASDNWIALVVYVVVVLVVARVVTNLQAARQEARQREEDTRRLFELSRSLIGDLTLAELLHHITTTVQTVFAPRWTALLLPRSETTEWVQHQELWVADRAGEELTEVELTSLTARGGQTRSLGLPGGDEPSRVAVALVVASNRPVGMLVLQEVQFARQDRAMLGTFANQAALAIELAQMQDQALRSRLLEEVDRWRRAMMGAVSHDLRTPLASIKTAVSSLRQDGAVMGTDDRGELLELIELQSDRLARLVTNLLDMTRIESGALALRSSLIPFDELAGEVLGAVGGLVPPERVAVESSADLPLLEIDPVLIAQVLANLLENAARLSPGESIVHLSARAAGEWVEISVSDDGPGIDASQQDRVFEMFSQNSGGGRAGLGLTIAKSFVEAHGGTIWIDPHVEQGARVVFTVPAAASVPAHA